MFSVTKSGEMRMFMKGISSFKDGKLFIYNLEKKLNELCKKIRKVLFSVLVINGNKTGELIGKRSVRLVWPVVTINKTH